MPSSIFVVSGSMPQARSQDTSSRVTFLVIRTCASAEEMFSPSTNLVGVPSSRTNGPPVAQTGASEICPYTYLQSARMSCAATICQAPFRLSHVSAQIRLLLFSFPSLDLLLAVSCP